MSNLGGSINGISSKQHSPQLQGSEHATMRRVLRDGWNTTQARGVINGHNRVITPFRAVNTMGDFLGRVGYVCNVPNPSHTSRPGRNMRDVINSCDSTGVPGVSGNVKFVADSSDYVRFKKQRAINVNYNDPNNGGDESNASYHALMAIRR
jgi:hypothetical protein